MKKLVKTKRKPKTVNLVFYVNNSTLKVKRFNSANAAVDFVSIFKANNPNIQEGFWVDCVITDIKGDIIPMDDWSIEE